MRAQHLKSYAALATPTGNRNAPRPISSTRAFKREGGWSMFNEIGFTHILLLAALSVGLYRVRKAIPEGGLRAWHERHVSPRAAARWHRVLVLEFVELILAGIFLLVGGAKLIGRPDMVALFGDIGVGQWFRYVTGAVEVSGAALLVVPFLSSGSAIVLAFVMFVATLIELFVLHRPPVAALAC